MHQTGVGGEIFLFDGQNSQADFPVRQFILPSLETKRKVMLWRMRTTLFTQQGNFGEILYLLMKDPKILCRMSPCGRMPWQREDSSLLHFLRTSSGPPELASERTD